MEVPLNRVYPNPDQPRKLFDAAKLEELAQSIKEQGLIEPIIVVDRPQGDMDFMIVAGERRWRACQLAGLKKAPVRFIKADENQIAEMALVENLQREDLKPLEEARAFKVMIDLGYSNEGLARRLGLKQWQVDSRINLLNLAEKFQEALELEIITPFEAYKMSTLKDFADQEMVFRKIKSGELSGPRQVRRFVNTLLESKKVQTLFALPKKEDLEIVSRWEKTLDAVTGLIMKSFSPDDCRVLAKVMNGNAGINVEKIDLIVKHLNLIKKAMLDNASRQEVAGLVQVAALFDAATG